MRCGFHGNVDLLKVYQRHTRFCDVKSGFVVDYEMMIKVRNEPWLPFFFMFCKYANHKRDDWVLYVFQLCLIAYFKWAKRFHMPRGSKAYILSIRLSGICIDCTWLFKITWNFDKVLLSKLWCFIWLLLHSGLRGCSHMMSPFFSNILPYPSPFDTSRFFFGIFDSPPPSCHAASRSVYPAQYYVTFQIPLKYGLKK